MEKVKTLTTEKSDLESDARDPATALEEIIATAGGVAQLARSIGVSKVDVDRWRKNGAVPMDRAFIIGILYSVPLVAFVSDEDAMWISLMELERSLKEVATVLEKSLGQTTAVIDAMMKLRCEI